MNDVSRNKRWNTLLRLAGFCAAIYGMYVSARFSVNGFQFSTDNPVWMGWGIAVIIIVLESVWQKFEQNRTLFVIAVVCYSYGIITNVVGIAEAKGGYTSMNFMDYVVAVVFGALFEVFPEPLLQWAISGDTTSDPLGRILDGVEEGHVMPSPTQSKSKQAHSDYRPPNQSKGHNFPKDSLMNKPVDNKLASPIFNQKYIERLKKK